VKNLRLRSEVVDPTFIRDKLGYDLYNIINLPTLSANYAKLYFNQKYMGFFLVRDAFKSHWIEQNYGEKNTTHLYSCDSKYGDNVFFNCHNDAKEDSDRSEDKEWTNFLQKLEKADTREKLAEFFDVDSYIKWQVSRYAFGSWDHVTRKHNNVVYMYHDTTNGRDFWIPFLYDFDLNFGARNIVNATKSFKEEVMEKEEVNPLYKILNINEESEEVRGILQEIFEKAFDPNKILSRIDQIRTFIAPYVLEDRTQMKMVIVQVVLIVFLSMLKIISLLNISLRIPNFPLLIQTIIMSMVVSPVKVLPMVPLRDGLLNVFVLLAISII